jgi:hypothetical protein
MSELRERIARVLNTWPPDDLVNGLMTVIAPTVAASDAAQALTYELDAEAERFRDEYAGYPENSAYNDGRTDSYNDAAERLRAALAPVADPDPHTTSDEEQTTDA